MYRKLLFSFFLFIHIKPMKEDEQRIPEKVIPERWINSEKETKKQRNAKKTKQL